MPTADQLSTETQTDWTRLRKQTDDDIARAVAADSDAAPIPTAEEMKLFKPTRARNPL